MDKQRDFVLRTIEERGIKFVRLWFTDVVGTLKSVAIAPAEVEGAFAEGLGFDGSAIEGLTRAFESDLLAHPDPTTFQILPWRGEIDPTARMFCDITTPDGQPSVSDPRNVLKRTLEKAADRGFTFYTHPEIEFYLLKSSQFGRKGPEPVDSAGYFDNVPGGTAHDFRRRSVRMLEDLGISVEFSHHEAGPGQNEIDLRYADALTTADNIMTFRTVIKEVAIEQGVYATFMPKPLSGHPGSGMHTHMSLFEGDTNAFFEAGAPVPALEDRPPLHRRSAAARARDHRGDQPVRQLLQAALGRRRGAELRVLGPQQPFRARPRAALQAQQGPELARRVPRDRFGGEPVPRLLADAGRGPQGHRRGLRASARGREQRVGAERRRASRARLQPAAGEPRPRHPLMEESELVAETLGEQVFNYVLLNKRQEWQAYRAQVTPYELQTNLEIL